MKTMNLKVGTRVVAIRNVPAAGARTNDFGTVIEPRNRGRSITTGKPVGPTFGPLVEWDRGTFCNVYPGQVAVLPEDAES